MFSLFSFGSKKNIGIPKEEKSKKLLEREIFSATEALEMGVEARNKKRNDNRREVFRQIKGSINYGGTSVRLQPYHFDDGNETYFEGLGFKVARIWVHPSTGEELLEEPTGDILVTDPSIQQWGGGVGLMGTGFAPIQRSTRAQAFIKVSWEK